MLAASLAGDTHRYPAATSQCCARKHSPGEQRLKTPNGGATRHG
jgi:hypothetical protein